MDGYITYIKWPGMGKSMALEYDCFMAMFPLLCTCTFHAT